MSTLEVAPGATILLPVMLINYVGQLPWQTREINWEHDLYPMLLLGRLRSLYEGAKPQPSTGYKTRPHSPRDFIQYWGWVLETRLLSPQHFASDSAL